MINLNHADLVVAGGGLSGSRVVIHVLNRLLEAGKEAGQKPIDIVMIDRFGEFGRGIPYGKQSPSGFLLIEPAAQSTPKEFRDWLSLHYKELLNEGVHHEDRLLQAWIFRYKEQLESGQVDGLYVPRKLFGFYIERLLRQTVQLAEERNLAKVGLITGEVTDVEPEESGFTIRLADDSSFLGRAFVLATGCIPRSNSCGLSVDEGYIHDLYEDAYAGLEQAVTERVTTFGRKLDILIAGSNASAIEAIYFLANRPKLLSAVHSINVVSSSGYLPGGVFEGEENEALTSGGQRPSAREYIETAARFVAEGLVTATQAKIIRMDSRADRRLSIEADGDEGKIELRADLVVNCTGAGRVNRTDSPLIRNLRARENHFKTNASLRGFQLRPNTYELDGADNGFVIGPLLNQDALETHVESILAVYRVAEELGSVLYQRLSETALASKR
ncbi:FAD/NAD(P)-binding protein [Paenibacillus ehimensis]|uniref:FAD/NAD(P)-binding protein n=1 Tax=Paenibacillus ehimensis TaxID=79264 RepID=A0ABT8VIJ2_9BACL|nr:FAD/NAD(P)-binding protein [Paenibacillus ehimensis]MDO3680780.1 FAD/NAD(P)-binding protein [Paenibacillus ehimensis]